MRKLPASMSMWIPAAVSLAARLAFIGRKSLWIDEALASGISNMGLGELVQKIATGTPHPPLAFLLIRFSVLLFGSSETGLRVLIALAVASASIPAYRLVRRSFGLLSERSWRGRHLTSRLVRIGSTSKCRIRSRTNESTVRKP